MRIRLDPRREESLLDQTRDQVLSALHAGLIRRGDRLPSLRQVAALSQVNVKTVMRIYARLQEEGLVELRRGSGAFASTQDPVDLEPAQATKLARLLRRHIDEATGLNVTPAVYATMVQRIVTRSALKNASVAVMECNEEQVRLFAREIRLRIGARSHPILISDLSTRGSAAGSLVRASSILAVTDFHRAEGEEIARRFSKPIVRLRLRRDYVPSLMESARRGRLAMIVSNTAFFPAFKRTLSVLGLKREHLERISIAADEDLPAVRRVLLRADAVYISPLCDRAIRRMLAPGVRLLNFAQHLAPESIEAIEATLLLSGIETMDGTGRG